MDTEIFEIHSAVTKPAAPAVGPEAFRGFIMAECDRQTAMLQPMMTINGDRMDGRVVIDDLAISGILAREHREGLEHLESLRVTGRSSDVAMAAAIATILATLVVMTIWDGDGVAAWFAGIGLLAMLMTPAIMPFTSSVRRDISNWTVEATYRKWREKVVAKSSPDVMVLGRRGFAFALSYVNPTFIDYKDVLAVWSDPSNHRVGISFRLGQGTRMILMSRQRPDGFSSGETTPEEAIAKEIAARIAIAKGHGAGSETASH